MTEIFPKFKNADRMNAVKRALTTGVLAVCSMLCAVSCLTTPTTSDTTALENLASPMDATTVYRLRVGDGVSYKVRQDPYPDASMVKVMVNSANKMRFPISVCCDDSIEINATGKSVEQIRTELETRLKESYYKEATVEMSLTEKTLVRGQVLFQGEVGRSSLDLSPDNPKTLSEALLLVSVTPYAKTDEVKVFRKGLKDPIIINVKRIWEKNEFEEDIILQDGDRVVVGQKWFNID